MLPTRRPSASTGNASTKPPPSSSIRTHRSKDSHHAFMALSSQTTAVPYAANAPGTQNQHNIITVLVNRLSKKLPYISGLDLTIVENDNAIEEIINCLVEMSRESLDIIALALSGLLDKLPKQTDSSAPWTIEILQSQLFILKVLSAAMASRWHRFADEAGSGSRSAMSKGPTGLPQPESPVPSSAGRSANTKKSRQASSEQLSTPPGWTEPPPLNEKCAQCVLLTMIDLLRQTAPPEGRLMSSSNLSFEATFHDFESIEVEDAPSQPAEFFDADLPPPETNDRHVRMQKPPNASSASVNSGVPSMNSSVPISQLNMKFEKTHKVLAKSHFSLNALILKFAGRILYHLSASNWSVVLTRLREKIRALAGGSDKNGDMIELNLMKHCALDRQRLVQILQELSSLLINMKREAKTAVAIPLRAAIWNWIDLFPAEYNEALRSYRRMEGAPERVFDLLWDPSESASARAIWPTLAVLGCISTERTRSDYELSIRAPGTSKSNMQKFVDMLLKNMNSSSKLRDVAIVCALDYCRGAARAKPEGDLPIRSIASDLAHDIQTALLKYQDHKPFWEAPEEIDVSMFADALVLLYRFSPLEDVLELFKTCVEPERSDAVKLCVVKACVTLSVESRQLPWQVQIDPIFQIAKRFRNIFKYGGVRRNEVDEAGNLKRTSFRPKAKRFTAETVSDRELLLIGILHLWKCNIGWSFTDMPCEELTTWVPAALKTWEEQTDPSVQYSIALALLQVSKQVGLLKPTDKLYEIARAWKLVLTPQALRIVSIAFMNSRMDMEKQRMWAEVSHAFVLEYIQDVPDNTIQRAMQLSEDRLPALVLLELASAVSLTSADPGVSRLAAHNLRVVAIAERRPEAPNSGSSDEERAKRFTIYDQIGDPKTVVIGRVAWQKRIRRLFRTLAVPQPSYVAVWEECYYRWCALTELVIRAPLDPVTAEGFQDGYVPVGDKSPTLEEQQHQWQNLTLFLAACGSACLVEQHEPDALQALIPAHLLPDSMRVLKDPRDLVGTFVTYLIDLLVSDSVMAREISKEALGSELSPRLYTKLFKHLDEVIKEITQGINLEWSEHFHIFLDQFIAVLKLLVENAQANDDVLAVDMTSTLHALARFIARFQDPASYRIRVKFCALCDSVFSRTDMMSLRKDTNARQQMLAMVVEWIKDPTHMGEGDVARFQQELNIASLRAAVHFLDRLQLTAPEGSGSDDQAHVVSRLFIRYSNLIMRMLEFGRTEPLPDDGLSEVSSFSQRARASQRDAELRELVIKGLSQLISANAECGIKHSLALAYDADIGKRTIFTHVFARVMGEDGKFGTQGTAGALGGRKRLCELVKESDIGLVVAMCETCPPAEIDILIPVLLNVFDTRASLMSLMKTLLDREIDRTEDEASLFRGNSSCTRLLSAFAKIHGYSYLRSLIIPLIKTMASVPPGHSYELDPDRVGKEQAERNRQNVEVVASSFLNIITLSVPALPSMFRELCAHIGKSVNKVWPEAKFAALGAFIFLRFISPAVVAPEIVDVEIPKDDGGVIRRGLMIIAKIIQNLANNIFFGKEPFMSGLNPFLQRNIVNITRFLSELNKYTPSSAEEERDEWTGMTTDDTDGIVLHRFFQTHADVVGRELLTTSKLSGDGDASVINGKRAWDALCAILVDLGQAIEIPRLSSMPSSEHREFIDLMSRNNNRDTSTVRDIFVETFTEKVKLFSVFVFFIPKIDVETLDIELLLYHMFKTLTLPAYEGRTFDVIYDWTSFSPSSQVPIQWLKHCIDMIPSDIRHRFMTAYILNPNDAAHKYLRRLYNITAGMHLSSEVKACSAIEELLQFVPTTCVAPLVYATSLEQEECEEFRHVTLRHGHDKTQAISQSLSCKVTEIVPLADISDVYSVATGHDPSEFIIRKTRQSATLYFSSPKREYIVRCIRAAKGRIRISNYPGTERFSRLSNVSAALLHIGMMNMGVEDDELRGASYELLASVMTSFDLSSVPLVSCRGLWIAGPVLPFLMILSERIASLVPQLTLDFISEVSTTLDKADQSQRLHCLSYMGPWLRNLAQFVDPTSQSYDHSGAKLRDCIRLLIDLTIADPQTLPIAQKSIWAEIGKLDPTLVSTVVEELMRAAVDGGLGSQRCETVALIMMPLSSINVRGQILSKMRKALAKTSAKPTRTLAENSYWGEIAALTRLLVVATQQCKQQALTQFYVPETIHMITLIAATGEPMVRSTLWGIIIDLLQSQWIARSTDVNAGPEIRQLVDEASAPETLRYFGLQRVSRTSELTVWNPKDEKAILDNHEGLTRFLIRVMEATSGSKGLLNVWRARWMSLVTSTAFQVSPAIQTRAFIVLGALATAEVDDDFFYQMLVAFKAGLAQAAEGETASLVSMLRCISNVVPGLVENSRYLPQIFWLAVALLQSSHYAFFEEACRLLRFTIEALSAQGLLRDRGVSSSLLDYRLPLEEIATQLDQLLSLSFDSNFSFSLAAIMFKGIRIPHLRAAATDALRTMLRISTRATQESEVPNEGPGAAIASEALGYFMALIPVSTSPRAYRQLLLDSNADAYWLVEDGVEQPEDQRVPRIPLNLLGVMDNSTALLIVSSISNMLVDARGDEAEMEMLFCLLSDLALSYPEMAALVYNGLETKIQDILANSTNPAILKAAASIFHVVMQEPSRNVLQSSASTLSTVEEGATQGTNKSHQNALEEIGMSGLSNTFAFLPANKVQEVATINQWISELIDCTYCGWASFHRCSKLRCTASHTSAVINRAFIKTGSDTTVPSESFRRCWAHVTVRPVVREIGRPQNGQQKTTNSASRSSSPESPLTSSLFAATSAIDDLTRSLANFSRVSTPEPSTSLSCCCAREDCEYTKAWLAVKLKLESRLILAAEVGQALLERHEAYVRRIQSSDREGKVSDPDTGSGTLESDARSHEELESRIAELVRENALLEKVGFSIHQYGLLLTTSSIAFQRFHQALVNNEMAESSNKAISQELEEARTIVGRLSTEHARSIGWDTRLLNLAQEKDDLQQERDNESTRARISEARLVEVIKAKLRAQVHRLQEDLEQRHVQRSELSEEILQDARERLEQIQHANSGRLFLQKDSEITKVLESLVADNEALQKSNTELQKLLADSRESIHTLQEEAEEQRALLKPSTIRAETPLMRHGHTHSNSSFLSSRDQLQPPSPNMSYVTKPGTASPTLSNYSMHRKNPVRRPASAEPRLRLGLESLAPNTYHESSSPADSLPSFSTKFGIDTDIHDHDEHVSPDRPRVQKPLLLLTRSRGVQTVPWNGILSPLPSDFGDHPSFSTSPRDGHSDSSSLNDKPSTFSILIDRIVQLFNRIAQADAFTLTNRLKRQRLLGADVSHLSRSTVEAILSDVTNLRVQYRSFLDDDKVVSTCTRKDLRALFKLFRDVFQELGTMRVTLNDIVLDPSLAPKVREMTLNLAKAEVTQSEQDDTTFVPAGWMAPLTKLFGAPVATDKEKRVFSPLARSGSRGRPSRPTRFVPKIAPATSASTTTVNVEFTGGGVGRAITSMGAFTPGLAQDVSASNTLTLPRSSSGNVSQNVMGIFAGAPRPDAAADPWVVVPKAGSRLRPKLSAAVLGGSNNTRAARVTPSKADAFRTLSRRVDAIIDNSAGAEDGPGHHPTLLERTLRRRGLSDSSIHTTFLNDGDDIGRPANEEDVERHRRGQDTQTVLQAFSRKVNNFRVAATGALSGSPTPALAASPPAPGRLSESPSAGRSGSVPHGIHPRAISPFNGMLPDMTSWAAVSYDLEPPDGDALYAGSSRQEPTFHRPWGRETVGRDL
ncbi:hypothetical protein EW146_g6666 [Bondarzewia mesenterica]|uniref:Ras-GAP domain-containing protein n=1 Tax=Bondarzewia mesenterica TaxID=1095465 RepID=A0A4S4LPX2_9AGAM|nr:hypothetical protein EW146_g6666 [Bondarzewia mesenterica]